MGNNSSHIITTETKGDIHINLPPYFDLNNIPKTIQYIKDHNFISLICSANDDRDNDCLLMNIRKSINNLYNLNNDNNVINVLLTYNQELDDIDENNIKDFVEDAKNAIAEDIVVYILYYEYTRDPNINGVDQMTNILSRYFNENYKSA